jgi:hypothetical protein
MSSLSYGKYIYAFQISDLASNNSLTWAIFYIDEPELIISTWSLDLWQLPVWSSTFSPEITITVKTVWAAFDVILNKNPSLTYSWAIIDDWDWNKWFWYDDDPYWPDISTINTNQIVASESQNINSDWNKNTYTYNLKVGSLINSEQAAGYYTWNLDFLLDLDY